MADIVDATTRSRMMSGIRGQNTKPEILIRKLLHKQGFRFRLHVRDLPGKPDIVLPRYRAVIFVHGCFWHRHDCHLFKMPKTREAFWKTKIEKNVLNDQLVSSALKNAGWRIAFIWECALKGRTRLDEQQTMQCLGDWLHSDDGELTIRGKQGGPVLDSTTQIDASAGSNTSLRQETLTKR